MSDWRIPLSDLDYGHEEEAAVLRVLRSRWLSMGAEVEAFEREFSGYVGTRHAIAVANGTAALQLTMLALGIGPGDEVVQPAINFVAAANMTRAVGAKPVFADIVSIDEPTIDPTDIERKFTDRTRAVIVMHYGGYLCRIAAIRDLCEKHHIALIEDACHAVGARCHDVVDGTLHDARAGSLGDAGCFSFFSNKNLATGEGGMVTTNRDDLAQYVRLLRSHGMSSMTWDRHRGHAHSYDVTAHGFNYRFDEIRAAIGRCQLEKLDHNNERRRELVSVYRRRLTELPNWIVPFSNTSRGSAYHLMVAVAPDSRTREQVARRLRETGIQNSLHYPCVPEFAAFSNYAEASVNLSRSFSCRAITLPLYPTMNPDDVDLVSTTVADASFLKHAEVT